MVKGSGHTGRALDLNIHLSTASLVFSLLYTLPRYVLTSNWSNLQSVTYIIIAEMPYIDMVIYNALISRLSSQQPLSETLAQMRKLRFKKANHSPEFTKLISHIAKNIFLHFFFNLIYHTTDSDLDNKVL